MSVLLELRSGFLRLPTLAAGGSLALSLLGCGAGDPASGQEEASLLRSASLDAVCVQSINAYRDTAGVPRLSAWVDSQDCLARQARDDAASGTAHSHFGVCGERAQNTCPGWNAAETDSSRQRTLRSCLRSMWNEGPGSDYAAHGHYLNMTSAKYSKVGCGFHHSGGALWINMDFR